MTIVNGKQRYRLKIGLPQGSPISPMLARQFVPKQVAPSPIPSESDEPEVLDIQGTFINCE